VPVADLDPARFLARLHARWLGRNFAYMPSCVSTNDEVAARARAGCAEGLLIAAGEQTGGRGRRGRAWHSPADENLYFSLLLRPALPAHLAAPVTLLAGAALAVALSHLEFAPQLKWPNDVLLDTPLGLRKVAGILAEMASEAGRVRHIVLGVGINVNTEEFPEALATLATSLRRVCGQRVDRGEVVAAFIDAFEPIYDNFVAHGPSTALAEWHRYAKLGKVGWVDRDGGRIEGVAEGVDASGALLVKTASGDVVLLHAGEVNWLRD
jgi:BirA family transcriptional regulator, biotin operon repressor / biotin---[acetyl-CoA-carboxylase] ligase